VNSPGADFGEGDEDEAAEGQARMRDVEFGRVNDGVGVKKNVDIDEAGAFGNAALATEGAFDGENRFHQVLRRQIRFSFDNRIEEPILFEEFDGLGFVKGR